MPLTTQHYHDLLPLAKAAGFTDLDLTSHQIGFSGNYVFTAMAHSNYAGCRMLATGLAAGAGLVEFLHAVRQELLAMAPVTYRFVGEAYQLAA